MVKTAIFFTCFLSLWCAETVVVYLYAVTLKLRIYLKNIHQMHPFTSLNMPSRSKCSHLRHAHCHYTLDYELSWWSASWGCGCSTKAHYKLSHSSTGFIPVATNMWWFLLKIIQSWYIYSYIIHYLLLYLASIIVLIVCYCMMVL